MSEANDFLSLDLSGEIRDAVRKMGFTETTPVQRETIPVMMRGSDIIAIAPTGTGKTLAFGIPMLEYISLHDQRVQEVVLAPTRELAMQIGEEISRLAVFIPEVRICVLYGGQPIARQMDKLKKKPQILIATPGRLLDMMKRGAVRLDSVHTLVLDEADEMLNMGFIKDVTRIIEAVPPSRQFVMFSATTSQDVMTISWKYQHDPAQITIRAVEENKPDITQYVIPAERADKTDRLLYLLDSDEYHRVMIFTNTRDMARRLNDRLTREGYPSEALHGDIPQNTRSRIMSDFKKGRFPILVCTDVAARGIDVFDVEAVINYDLPGENEYYLHRIGRTGRAKRHGVAFTLLSFQDSIRLDDIMKYMHSAAPIPLHFNENGILCGQDGAPFFTNI